MIQKFHPVSGSRAFGRPYPDGSICSFDRDSIAWHGDLDPHALDFADEWLNDEELIKFVTLDGKIIGAADRTLTADEVAAYERRRSDAGGGGEGGEYEVLLTTEALIKVRNLALRRLELGATGSDDDGIALAAFQVEATPKTVLTIANALLRQQHSDLDLMALLGKRTAERDTAVKTNRSNARSLAVAVLRDCAGKYVRVDSQRDIDRAVDLAERIIVAWPDDPPLFQPPVTK